MAVLKYYDANSQQYHSLPLGNESIAVANWNYSENEQVIGRWVNGKPIYRSVVDDQYEIISGEEVTIPNLTSNTSNVIVSSQYSSYPAYYALDGKVSTRWSPGGAMNGYVGYEFDNAILIQEWSMAHELYSGHLQASKVDLQASNDGQTWVTLDSKTEIVDYPASDTVISTYKVNATTKYKMFRAYCYSPKSGWTSLRLFNVKGILGGGNADVVISNIKIDNKYLIEYTKKTDAENSFIVDMLSSGDLSTEATDEEVAAVLG